LFFPGIATVSLNPLSSAAFIQYGLARNPKAPFFVIPAKAGIQTPSRRKPGTIQKNLDPGFRRGDGFDDFFGSIIQ
jgi:hypothetical protein